jgi:uncharacterized repeat protein (TIGR02543 family)
MALTGVFAPEDMFTNKFPVADGVRVIPAGTAPFKRGAILTAANAPVASGGTPDCIALEDVDASGGAMRCVVALSGGFNSNFLSTADGSDPASFSTALRAKSIYLDKGLLDGGPATWTITYVLNGGVNDPGNPASYTAADLPIALAAATKSAAGFDGWYADPGLTEAVTQIPNGSEGNLTLYAKFTAT